MSEELKELKKTKTLNVENADVEELKKQLQYAPYVHLTPVQRTTYVLDFEKVHTLQDVINVLKGLGIHVYTTPGEDLYQQLESYLKPKE